MKNILSLLKTIKHLRDPESGCPWDLKQTHKSLRPYVIEEAYEVVEAIDAANPLELADELGDLLLQVLLHAQIASEAGAFTFEDIALLLNEKMIRRHPHVFGDKSAKTTDEVKKHWESAKKIELQHKDTDKNSSHRLSSIPKNLPALYESYKIGKKVVKDNFDWNSVYDIREKVGEELRELDEALSKQVDRSLEMKTKKEEETQEQIQEHIEEELGDLFFTLAQLARKLNFDPESCLKQANRKFTLRYNNMEEISKKPLSEHTKEELETLWGHAKNNTSNHKYSIKI